MIEIESLMGKMDASVTIPASKSYMNRALIIGTLGKGESRLKNISICDDTQYMISGLQKLGVEIKKKDDFLAITGTGGDFPSQKSELFLGNAGTTVRFLTCLATLVSEDILIEGDERMNQRPIRDLIDALNQMGVNVQSKFNNGCPPLLIKKGKLKGGEVFIDCTQSSQYLSSLLMCCPYADSDVTIKIKKGLVSKPYIDMTLSVMKHFGSDVRHNDYQEFFVSSDNKYTGKDYFVEGDASGASYFFAAAAINKGRIKVYGINSNTLQGDVRFLELLEMMGCRVVHEKDYIEVEGGDLTGIDIDMNSMPDVVQTLAMVALFAKGETTIRNVGNLKIKETDRIAALRAELTKVGAQVSEIDEGICIKPSTLKPAQIKTHNDHRMAMSFSLLGLVAPGIKIENPECVSKSFPDFYHKINELRRS